MRFALIMLACLGVLGLIPGSQCFTCSQTYQCSVTQSYRAWYYTNCGLWGWSRCTRYRIAYRRAYSTCRRCCTGYTGTLCTDRNECASSNGGCAHNCVNTVGSYRCTCRAGYQLYGSRYCRDINECSQGNGACAHNCVNTAGSYRCTCRSGYQLSGTRNCVDIDECSSNNGGCDHNCLNTVGSYRCTCRTGYQLSGARNCIDINECSNNNGGCDHICTNTVGSYICTCLPGYHPSGTLHCISESDNDECVSDNGGCQQTCVNTEGSFYCSCQPGYNLDANGLTCSDINECASNNGGCANICVNTAGSYVCTCRPGHQQVGTACVDIDECQTGIGTCQQICTNTPGSFYCSCQPGYTLDIDGVTCHGVDECRLPELQDCHYCLNTPGSYICTCRDGHRLVNGKECRDVDLYPYGLEVGSSSQLWYYYHYHSCRRQTLPMEGFRFFGRRHLYIHVCDNGIVSFDTIRRPYWPVRLMSHQWWNSAVIAPFLATSRPLNPYISTNLFYELYSKDDGNPYTPAILRRARDDGRSTRGFYLPYYDPVWAVVVTWTNVVPDSGICPGGYCPVHDSMLPRNSFQLVLSTDGTNSFAHFIYPTMKIEWASPDELLGQTSHPNAIAVAGYNAGQGWPWWLNHAEDMAYSGTMRMKRAWLTYGGHWSYPLQRQNDPYVPQPSVLHCAIWLRLQRDDQGLSWFLRYVYNTLGWAYACPCTAEQAFYDNTYSYTVSRSCAESRRRYTFTYGGRTYSTRRTCCYSPAYFWWETRVEWRGWWWSRRQVTFSRRRIGGGRLLRGSQGGHLIINRWGDEQAHRHCCVDSGRLRNGWYCRRFSQFRPWSVRSSGNPCRHYPVYIGWIRAWGDPHITTLDGVRYAFNGLGEFVVVDVDDGEYQVQGRTCFASGSNQATVFCAIAAAQKNHTSIQVNLASESGVDVYVNNSAVDISMFEEDDFELEIDESAIVTQPSNNSILIVFFSGISVKVTANKAMLLMEFSAPVEYMNKTRGLLGRWDADTSNDFEFFNGTMIPSKSSERQIFDMGSSWQVTDEDGPKKSIFHYKNGEDVSNFTSTGFVPKFTDELDFSDADLEEEAREVCGNDTSCLFDVAETGDIDVGRMEQDARRKFESQVSVRDTFPPVIDGPEAVFVSLGEVTEININVSDPAGLNVTFETGNEVPPEVSVLVNGTDVTILWNVTSDEIFNLQLVVTNTENSSAEYWPVVYMCSCRNNGSCNTSSSMDPALVSDDERFVTLNCVCQDGYTGAQCETDIDACAANFDPCFPGVNCTDLPPPADVDGYECGECLAGYQGNGTMCQDVDECETEDGLQCQHICANTIGNFTCDCHLGYYLLDDGFLCFDIDECTLPNNCSQRCDNTDGSYNCSCWDGFDLESDGQSCTPENPCEGGTDPGCDPETGWCVVNGTGTALCVCETGYELAHDGVTCQDKDECESGESHCNQLCNNTVGGYTCYCEEGYELTDDPVQPCRDTDECYEGTNNCTVNEICVNIPGTYYCVCAPGTTVLNGVCVPDMPQMTSPAMSTEPLSTTTKQTQSVGTNNGSVTVGKPPTTPDIAKPISEQEAAANTTIIVIGVLSTTVVLIVLALIYWRMRTKVKTVQLSGDSYRGSRDDLVVGQIGKYEPTMEMNEM